MKSWKWLKDDSGQDLVEYAFLLAFIAAACILALQHLGVAINDVYNSTSTTLVGSVS